ncbi:MAG TPA: hypothetical protein PK765_01000 [bacterium]|nr:hypothetical protein [bacterium]
MLSIVRFDKNTLAFVLNIDPIDIPLSIRKEAESLQLLKKDEFHITIIGRATGEILTNHLQNFSQEKRINILATIETLITKTIWNIRLENEYFFIEKAYQNPEETRKSIIQIANTPELNQFYKELEILFEVKLDLPIPHVTLFTNSTREKKKLRGIGIYSASQMQELNPKKIQ